MRAPHPRYELKLVCSGHQLAQAQTWIHMHPAAFQTTYPPRRVNSLYLDTLHLSSLAANLDGLSVRSKLRCRWYGDGLSKVRAQLEWKHKQNMLGTKEIVALDDPLDMTLPWREILPLVLGALPADRVGSLWRHRLQTIRHPALLNRYWREYYATLDGTVRVTLDYNQVAYDQRLIGSHLNVTTPLPIEDAVIIEVKADRDEADRADAIISRFPLSRTRNSKYAKGMLTSLYSQ